jgi:hypothetical protein
MEWQAKKAIGAKTPAFAKRIEAGSPIGTRVAERPEAIDFPRFEIRSGDFRVPQFARRRPG